MFGIKVCKETPYGMGNGFSLDDLLSTISNCVNTVASAGETLKSYSDGRKQIRRTEAEIHSDLSGTDKSPYEFQYSMGVPLHVAINMAQNIPGVYVLYLNGKVMKCGRASYESGVAWRLRQYYNLSYDKRSRSGELWSVNEENREQITVSWQCCPVSKCGELESKLFEKYGKGEWAKRAPISHSIDSWELLI